MSTRDNFSPATKETLAKRVGWRCSNPDCNKLTIGPHEEATKSVNIGVAAHITAAASGLGAKRYNPNLSMEERKAITNGIWLCQNCGKLIDSNEPKYSVELLLNWKRDAENRAALEVENANQAIADNISFGFRDYLEKLINEPQKWWLDAINDLTWFEFPLSSTTKEKPKESNEQPKNTPPQLVLDAIKDYAHEKILIVGPPGAGKSTLLEKICRLAAVRAIENVQAPIPVLVELRDYTAREGFRGLILKNLASHDERLDEGDLNKLLKQRRLLLLVDGLNEKPEAQREFTKFWGNIPLIATGRQEGDSWSIERKLELQPLSTEQVKAFFELRLPELRLPNADRTQLQALGDRVKDFGQTPLMVWMLYSIFRANKDVPETRGEAYRSFTALYVERAKDGIDLSDARSLLGKLAFEMMRSKKVDDPTHFSLKILEGDAQNILGSEAILKRMLNHLLKQQGKAGNQEISFCHQSLQEYYAAEYLMSDRQRLLEWLSISPNREYSIFQQDYLNYQKWTEPIALLLGLCEEEIAFPIVEQALDVDLMLGARLAGEVRSIFPKETGNLLRQKSEEDQIPYWLRIQFFPENETSSKQLQNLDKTVSLNENDVDIPISELISILENECTSVVYRDSIKKFIAVDRKTCISTLIRVSKDLSKNPEVRFKALNGIGKHRFREAIPDLIQLINDKEELVRFKAIQILGLFGDFDAVPELLGFLAKSDNSDLHGEAIKALGDIGCKDAARPLINILSSNSDFCIVIEALGKIKSEEAVDPLIKILTESKDHNLKCYSIEALGKIGCCDANFILEKLLKSRIDLINSKSKLYLSDPESEYEFSHSAIAQVEKNISNLEFTVIIALGRIGLCNVLPLLRQSFEVFSFSTILSKEAFFAIHKIQSKCKFYNYEIQQAKPKKADRTFLEGGGGDRSSLPPTITCNLKELNLVLEQHPIFNQQGATIGVNYAAANSNPKIIQNIQQESQDTALLAIVQIIQALEKKYTFVQDPQQAIAIIDAEFKELEASRSPQWQNFLKIKRLYNGGKKAAVKVGEHFTQENVWGKGFVAFLEGVSEDVK